MLCTCCTACGIALGVRCHERNSWAPSQTYDKASVIAAPYVMAHPTYARGTLLAGLLRPVYRSHDLPIQRFLNLGILQLMLRKRHPTPLDTTPIGFRRLSVVLADVGNTVAMMFPKVSERPYSLVRVFRVMCRLGGQICPAEFFVGDTTSQPHD